MLNKGSCVAPANSSTWRRGRGGGDLFNEALQAASGRKLTVPSLEFHPWKSAEFYQRCAMSPEARETIPSEVRCAGARVGVSRDCKLDSS